MALTGGAIYSNNGTINMTSTKFNSNLVSEEAAAIFMSKTKFDIYDTEFSENASDEDSSVITIKDLIGEEEGTFRKCNFTDNQAVMQGAISLYNVSVFMDECKFDSNKGFFGGAVYMTDETHLNVIFSNFSQNQALNGSVFYVEDQSSLEVEYTIFQNNIASEFGAVAYVEDFGNTIHFINCDFIDNIGFRNDSIVYPMATDENNISFD